jgi:hypothetical protein
MTALLLATALALTLEPEGSDHRPVDFDTEVIPVLTRAGCNAGSCHGAAVGRGGFRLSLFGSNPARDYDAIVRELEGRRVDLARPDESLVLTKPSGLLDHEGGLRLKPGGTLFTRLRDWLRSGAPRLGARRVVSFTVDPASAVVHDAGEPVVLRATARFNDGASDDVTGTTVFQAVDRTAVEFGAERGRTMARVTHAGQHVVVARFLDWVVPVELTLPLGSTPVDLAGERRVDFVDDEVLALLEVLRLPVSPPADDGAFLRRVCLDLTGRLPEPEARSAFLADPDPDKRVKVVDRLLASEVFVEFRTFRLGEWLRVGAVDQDADGARAFQGWLREQVVRGTSFDELVRALVLALGYTRHVGPASFYAVAGDPRTQAEYVAQAFLGIRLQCANCHNHPLDRWTQDDYHGLAALFAPVERGRDGIIRLAPRGEVTHPATGAPARHRIPGERFLEATPGRDLRIELADWLTDRDNVLLARAAVNRLWRYLMGRGLVEPVDDLRATNPPTHPGLLDKLAADFVSHGYSLRHALRVIATSAAYGRSSAATDANRADDRFYSHALTRPLSAEVLADTLAAVTGVAEPYAGLPPGTRAVALVGPQVISVSLDVLGRCPRLGDCETPATTGAGLSAQLHRLNGPLVNRRLSAPDGRLRSLLAEGRTETDVLGEFYIRAVGRPPSVPEQSFWDGQFSQAGSAAERAALLEDAVWSLLSGTEFTTNH